MSLTRSYGENEDLARAFLLFADVECDPEGNRTNIRKSLYFLYVFCYNGRDSISWLYYLGINLFPGGTALWRVQGIFSEQCRRVFCLLVCRSRKRRYIWCSCVLFCPNFVDRTTLNGLDDTRHTK